MVQFMEYAINVDDNLHKLSINLAISHNALSYDSVENNLPDPLAKTFNLDEDRLLVKTSLTKKEDGAATTAKDLLSAYKHMNKAEPLNFPKEMITVSDLGKRVAELKHLGLRYQMLYTEVMQELERIRKEQEEEKEQKELAKHGKKKKQVAKKPQLEEQDSLEDIAALLPSESFVDIHLTTQKYKTYVFRTKEQYLKRSSEYFKNVLRDTAADENNVKHVHVNENDPEYVSHELYDALTYENFARYIKYAEHPDIQDKYRKVLEQYESVKETTDSTLARAVEELEHEKKSKIEELKTYIGDQKTAITAKLEKCMSHDIEKIRLLYQMHIQNTSTQIDNLLTVKISSVEAFYNTELEKTKKLFEELNKPKMDAHEKRVKKYHAAVDAVLPNENILSVLILAEILDASELRERCVSIISQNFSDYRRRDALSSTYIRLDTKRDIFSKLNVDILKDMAVNIDYRFQSALVVQELENRKSVLADEYKEFPLENLIKERDKGCVFPDILEKEISKRRELVPFVRLDKLISSPYIDFSHDFLTASLKCHQRYATVFATHSRTFEGWGKWYFEVTILKHEQVTGSTISLGWEIPRPSGHSESVIPGLSPDTFKKYGFGWQSDGLFHYDGKSEFINEPFGEGDVLGFAIDQDRFMLTFFKNGRKIIILRKEMSGGRIREFQYLEIKDRMYKLVPVCSFYSTKKEPEMSVRFNFAGPFVTTGLLHYESYGNEKKFNKQMKKIQQKSTTIDRFDQ